MQIFGIVSTIFSFEQYFFKCILTKLFFFLRITDVLFWETENVN